MKKWFLLATAILTFSGVSGAALYQHQANAGTDTKQSLSQRLKSNQLQQ